MKLLSNLKNLVRPLGAAAIGTVILDTMEDIVHTLARISIYRRSLRMLKWLDLNDSKHEESQGNFSFAFFPLKLKYSYNIIY